MHVESEWDRKRGKRDQWEGKENGGKEKKGVKKGMKIGSGGKHGRTGEKEGYGRERR